MNDVKNILVLKYIINTIKTLRSFESEATIQLHCELQTVVLVTTF